MRVISQGKLTSTSSCAGGRCLSVAGGTQNGSTGERVLRARSALVRTMVHCGGCSQSNYQHQLVPFSRFQLKSELKTFSIFLDRGTDMHGL
jgi:hypothetical protein